MVNLNKISCTKCHSEVTTCNFERHYDSNACRSGGKIIALPQPTTLVCQHCNKLHKNLASFRSHETTCPQNINRKYVNGMTGKRGWNKGLTKENDERVLKASLALKTSHDEGRISREPYRTVEFRQKMSNYALKQGFGGYQPGCGIGKKYQVTDSYGNVAHLQSSYEKEFSDLLNDLGISWERPSYFEYALEDKTKKYYPDFYLVDFDIYVDTKNDYLIQVDAAKIAAVNEQNEITLFVVSKEQITEEYIRQITK